VKISVSQDCPKHQSSHKQEQFNCSSHKQEQFNCSSHKQEQVNCSSHTQEQKCSSHKQEQSIRPKVVLHNRQSCLEIPRAVVENTVLAVLEHFQVDTDEIVVHFVSSRKISALHKKFFDDPAPTDCISFPCDGPLEKKTGYRILGEIFICPEVAVSYTRKNGGDSREEVTLYLIHGLLHLLGYDDLAEEQRALMRQKEAECLQKIAHLEQARKTRSEET
jgi:probable rRNA maturation factor